ncbi:AraC family transcriptional regulator [bacterium]|nr:MAG: AraC family transcriptional regulator [bacterium]
MDEFNSQPTDNVLDVEGSLPIDAQLAGIVISRGEGRHIERIASHFVLLVVRQGILYIEEEGKEFEVHEGQALLLWPGRHHQGTRDYDENLQFFWLHFTMMPRQKGQETLSIPQHTQLTRPDFVTELFRRFLDDQGTGTLLPLGAALYSWMILMEVAATGPTNDTHATAALAVRVHTYIRTHHHERISVSDVAQAVGYHPQYLARIYRQTYKVSLSGAIRRVRIDHAKWLLLHTESKISKIALLSGFEDASYFQRVFKQLEGITPLQFRRMHAHMNVNY